MKALWVTLVVLACGCSGQRVSPSAPLPHVMVAWAVDPPPGWSPADIRRSFEIADFEHVTKEEAAAALRVMDERRRSDLRDRFPEGRFQQFPAQVRDLIRHEIVEADLCRGPGNEATATICNNAHFMRVKLARLGWCWGGGEIAAERHWLRCEEDPSALPAARAPFEGEEMVADSRP